MQWKKISLIFFAVIISTFVFADTVVHYAPMSGLTLTVGIDGKKAGEVISLLTDANVAAYCDFSKQIVATKTSILCIYNGN